MPDREQNTRRAKGAVQELIDRIGDAIRGALEGLAPEHDAIPIPVRPDRHPAPRR